MVIVVHPPSSQLQTSLPGLSATGRQKSRLRKHISHDVDRFKRFIDKPSHVWNSFQNARFSLVAIPHDFTHFDFLVWVFFEIRNILSKERFLKIEKWRSINQIIKITTKRSYFFLDFIFPADTYYSWVFLNLLRSVFKKCLMQKNVSCLVNHIE